MAKDHKPPKARQLFKVWTRGRKWIQVAQERAMCEEYVAKQKMRSVPSQMTAGAAQRFSIPPFLEIKFKKRLCSLQRRRERIQRT